jgi:cob(I)alamin adenosyltransferase
MLPRAMNIRRREAARLFGARMPRITKVYTRTGDDGTTGLGSGTRVPKTDPRIVAYGTVDELNSHIGAVLALPVAEPILEPLRRIQNELFHIGADLCVPDADKGKWPMPKVEQRHVEALERLMDALSEELEPLQNFVLPGGTPASAALHIARTVCRRAEREVLALAAREQVSPDTVRYLNRLSDALFVMARFDNKVAGVPEPSWDSRA